MQKNNLKFLFLKLCLSALIFNTLFAQRFTDSPYSRFGIGDIAQRTFSQSNALGGSRIALKNDTLLPLFINIANPASYSGLALTTFEAGVNSTFNKFSNSKTSNSSNNTSLNYIAFGFPIKKSIGACFGIMPLSAIGYDINHYSEVENIGEIKENYEGSGGTNQIFVGSAWKPFSKKYLKYKNSDNFKNDLNNNSNVVNKKLFLNRWLSSISFGANAYYYFGTINTYSRLIYPDVSNTFNTKVSREIQLSAFSGSFGLQNTFTISRVKTNEKDTVSTSPSFKKRKFRELKKKLEITIGYIYSMNNSLNANYSEFANTFLYFGFARNESIRDTIYYKADQKGIIKLPETHGIGISIRKGNNLNVLFDVEKQLWSNFVYLNEKNNLQDLTRISIGAEWVPNRFTNTQGDYFKRIHYRFGIRYCDGYLTVNKSKVSDKALTFGLGLPAGSNKLYNTLNLSVEIGETGSLQQGLIKYNYVKATIGFSFNDRWFLKYKYD
jgi:hypothetical protein